MRITLLIRSLGIGGAERQVAALAAGLRESGHEVSVLVFYGGGPLESGLAARGVQVVDLAKGGRWDVFAFPVRLLAALRRTRADAIYAVLDVPNVFVALLRPWLRGARVAWGLRSSYVDYSRYDWTRGVVSRIERWLARVPDVILVNSRAGARFARARGFPAGRLRVVRNGIDTERFRPDPAGRARVRGEWGVGPGERVIGTVGRFDPIKDLDCFLAAAARVSGHGGALRFALVGGGEQEAREHLERRATELGIADRLVFAGARDDMTSVYSALDVLCSSSLGEGFPNVLAEAMACGVPCVATDVGDSADIVSSHGVIVPPRDPGALAQGLVEVLERLAREGDGLASACRAHVTSQFTIERLVHETRDALAGPAAGAARVGLAP